VKERVTEVLYSWTLWLKEEAKIQEAYRLLIKQGIVKKDPKLQDRVTMPPPPQRATESVFDQEGKAELLARLLKSTCPEDLQTANRLIKATIKEEQEKAERESKRVSTLKEVETSTAQLRELLEQTSRTGAPVQHSEELKTTGDDVALAQILAANDELTLAVTTYKERAAGKEGGWAGRGKTSPPTFPRGVRSYHLIDLSSLDVPPDQRRADSPLSLTPPPPSLSSSPPLILLSLSPPSPGGDGTHRSGVDLELIDLGLEDHPVSRGLHMRDEEEARRGATELFLPAPSGSRGSVKGSDNTWSSIPNQPPAGSRPPLPLQTQPGNGPPSLGKPGGRRPPPQDLANAHVPMETIRPSQLQPITVRDQAGVHVSLHFARDPPAGCPGVAVMVLSAVNTSTLPVRNFLFQAAVPKGMSVKLQPSSGSQLTSYNPLLPPAAISQVLLLANPQKVLLLANPQKLKVRLRYKLALLHGDQPLSETGEIESFPPWTSLVPI
ncbi:hypothetical protein CRUP_008752, partial [Coryphaenoides rupestris]